LLPVGQRSSAAAAVYHSARFALPRENSDAEQFHRCRVVYCLIALAVIHKAIVEGCVADSYTTFWTHDRCRAAKRANQEGKLLTLLLGGPHLSQPSFRRAGVKVGDSIYPIAIYGGVLYIIAHMRVHALSSIEDHIAHHPELFAKYEHHRYVMSKLEAYFDDHPEQRYLFHTCTDEVVIGIDGTPICFDIALPSELTEQVRFRSQRRERPIKHLDNGRVTSAISLQGIYRLSESTALLFNRQLTSALKE
jgi:hypothetical protein